MTGYVYRGTRRDTMIDLEAANAAIMAERDDHMPQMPVRTFEWPVPAPQDPKRVAAGRAGGQARARKRGAA